MENNGHPTFGNGKICYIEIPAADINASAKFYETCFGWHIRTDNNGVASFDDAVTEVSGRWVTGRKAHTGDGLMISIMVFDILATCNLVKDNGGAVIILPDMNAKDKVANITDPYGNVWGLYQHGQ